MVGMAGCEAGGYFACWYWWCKGYVGDGRLVYQLTVYDKCGISYMLLRSYLAGTEYLHLLSQFSAQKGFQKKTVDT